MNANDSTEPIVFIFIDTNFVCVNKMSSPFIGY